MAVPREGIDALMSPSNQSEVIAAPEAYGSAVLQRDNRYAFVTSAAKRTAWLATNLPLLVFSPVVFVALLALVSSLVRGMYEVAATILVVGMATSVMVLAIGRAVEKLENSAPDAIIDEAAQVVRCTDPANLAPLGWLGLGQSLLLGLLLYGTWAGYVFGPGLAVASLVGLLWTRRTCLTITTHGIEIRDPARLVEISWDDLLVLERILPRTRPDGTLRTALLLMSSTTKSRTCVLSSPRLLAAIRPLLAAAVPPDRFVSAAVTTSGPVPIGASELK